jgi:FAD/FMN-containing dehydrogenase
MDWIGPDDPRYDLARRISNARFDLRPSFIGYPSTEAGVRTALREAGRPVRIRSGGHNHEGMCTGAQAWVIDVSKLNCINIRGDLLTVGPGARLGNIYDALWEERMLLPGGGCADVCIGGLVQGAGWGPYSRRLGLTCDRLVGFRMARVDGTMVDVTRNDGPTVDPLFWAVAGAGGGNFGVITELRFRLEPLGNTPITSFTVSWRDRTLYAKVLDDWASHFPFDDQDVQHTSFLRLTKLAGGAALEDPIIVAGNYLGDETRCEDALKRLLPGTYALKTSVQFDRVDKKKAGREVFQHPQYQPGPPVEAVQALADAGGLSPDLGNTCAGYPFPHKVSSTYPTANFGFSMDDIAAYLSLVDPEPTARRYLSLHCFGGAIQTANPWSCFGQRERPFLLQYQAWWANPGQTDVEERCKEWVRGFRKVLKSYTVGSFMNFPDLELATDRKTLLEIYYGDKLADLIKVKQSYDIDNVLDFPMGIPTS